MHVGEDESFYRPVNISDNDWRDVVYFQQADGVMLVEGTALAVIKYSELVPHRGVARDLGVTYLVRGLRNATDFDYEANMDYFNKGLAPELETVYLIASHEVTPVSSSRVRELIYFEGDISSYVPQAVVKEVEAKRGKQERI